jgi:glycosyltransferase involved in cell wall biosynthesis
MNLLILSTIPTDACTYYRALQPLRNYRRKVDVRFTVLREITPSKLMEFDAVYMVRPALPEHFSIAQQIKDLGLKLWVDYDDDMFSIPYDHDAWSMMATDTVRHTIARICRLADVVTVSTDSLKKQVDKICGVDSIVMPNFIDTNLYPEPRKPLEETPKVISWRGGDTHKKDLEAYRESFVVLCKRYRYRFCFMGMRPIPLRDHLPFAFWSHLEKTDYITGLYKNLMYINAAVHVVPLQDTLLNRSKSNLAFLEATWFGGSAVVGPEWWVEAVNAKDQDSFVANVVELMENKEKRTIAYNAAVQTIRAMYSADSNEKIIEGIFEKL